MTTPKSKGKKMINTPVNVAVVSFCGSVGKTTVTANLLYPRLKNPDAKIFAIETINKTAEALGLPVTVIKGTKFDELYKAMPRMKNGIIDVGHSNSDAFIRGLIEYPDAEMDLDYIIVPCMPGDKGQTEPIKTLEVLKEMGIDGSKVHLVFNQVKEDVTEECAILLNHVKRSKYGNANPECTIYQTDVFNLLAAKRLTVQAALEDPINYHALLRTEEVQNDAKKFDYYSDMRAIKALSQKATQNLDVVFENIFKA